MSALHTKSKPEMSSSSEGMSVFLSTEWYANFEMLVRCVGRSSGRLKVPELGEETLVFEARVLK